MNGKKASIAAGICGTLLFGIFLYHNQTLDLQRKYKVESSLPPPTKKLGEEKFANPLKNDFPVIIAVDNSNEPVSQQPSNTPNTVSPGKRATKTRAS